MIILHKIISQDDINNNPQIHYLSPDNDKREWKEYVGDNVLTLRCRATIAHPWTDSKYDDNVLKIKEDLQIIKDVLKKGGILILSRTLLGDGMDTMSRDCPRTYEHLSKSVHDLVEKYSNHSS